jgi:hypothetical protein
MKQELTNEEKLKDIESKIKKIEEERIKKTEQLRILREQRDDIKTQLSELGLDPLSLPDTIRELQKEINDEIRKLEAMIPVDVGWDQ